MGLGVAIFSVIIGATQEQSPDDAWWSPSWTLLGPTICFVVALAAMALPIVPGRRSADPLPAPSSRTGVKMRGARGRINGGRFRNQDTALDLEDSHLDANDLDIG
jgi:hypothetical protein